MVIKYQTFAETTKKGGESHKKQKKPCQDRSFKYSIKGIHIVVVADGHGSDNCFRSEYGAKFAVKAATNGIFAFIKNLQNKELSLEENFARQVKKLAGNIVDNWILQVSEHYHLYPITEEDKDYPTPEGKMLHFKGLNSFQVDNSYRDLYLKEASGNISGKGGLLTDDGRPVTRHAYGTTLIAAAITEDYWFGLQIGDGKLTAFYPDGTYDQPVPWDDKCYLNVTTSICDDDAAERARVYVKKRGSSAAAIDAMGTIKKLEDNRPMPSAIFLNSDGVDDSFPIEENMNHIAKKFYYPVLRMFIENKADSDEGWKASVKELADYLPDLSKRGSGDDISVAGIIDMDAVKSEPFCEVLQKAKVEAEERRAREKEEREKAVKAAEAARAEETARKVAKEEAAAKTVEAKKAIKETKAIVVVQADSSSVLLKTVQQPADDPIVQEKTMDLEGKQEFEKEEVSIHNEIQQETKGAEPESEFGEFVGLSPQKNTEKKENTDISSSKAYKVQASTPQQGTNVDIEA